MDQQDDILMPPYLEWDVDDLPEDQWWREFSIEKALKIIEKDSICLRNIFYNPSIVAVEQLIKYVLYSDNSDEVQKAEDILIKLLNKDLLYQWIIACACRHQVGMDVDIRKFIRGKADYFLNLLNKNYPFKVENQMDESIKRRCLEVKPILVSTFLAFTDDPIVLPILIDMVKSDNSELSASAFYAIIVDSRFSERYSIGESLYNQVGKFERKRFIEEVSTTTDYRKILNNIRQKETDEELSDLLDNPQNCNTNVDEIIDLKILDIDNKIHELTRMKEMLLAAQEPLKYTFITT